MHIKKYIFKDPSFNVIEFGYYVWTGDDAILVEVGRIEVKKDGNNKEMREVF